jgi:hypothetical protein
MSEELTNQEKYYQQLTDLLIKLQGQDLNENETKCLVDIIKIDYKGLSDPKFYDVLLKKMLRNEN